ncbi:unnamed protein product [Rotaria magnacalcarata]|uniref:Transmembrane protein n=1 Tax=Rotaria magnacalcarata TaxID=392030 RepID=A0A816TII0_9BILA|nr:unnamed protein product [Rotaria magnacalcarata]
MKHEQGSEQVAMIEDQSMPRVKPLSPTEDPQIQRIRKILLIILGIFIALSVIRTIVTFIYAYIGSRPQDAALIVPVFLTLLLEAFGFFATYKYHELGLRVFAWLTVISLSLSGIGLVIGLCFLVDHIFSNSGRGAQYRHVSYELSMYVYFSICVWIVPFIVAIIVTVLVFKLAKLIRMKKSETTTPI